MTKRYLINLGVLALFVLGWSLTGCDTPEPAPPVHHHVHPAAPYTPQPPPKQYDDDDDDDDEDEGRE